MANFDFSDDQAITGNTIPEGIYPVRVVDTNFLQSKTGNPMIAVVFEVFGEKCSGFKVRHWFLLGHSDPETHANMRGKFKGWRSICGDPNINSLSVPENYGSKEYPAPVEQLHGLECLAKVKVEDGDYGQQNKISFFKEAGGSFPNGKPAPTFGGAKPKSAVEQMDGVPF